MGRVCILLTILLLTGTGCAVDRVPSGLAMPASSGLAMPAPDEARAASLLAGYLLAQGWTVRLADETLVEASRGEERLQLEPQLDPLGLDRIVISRSWPRDPQADDEALRAFALELNDTLNVGQFRGEASGLVLQSSLPFLEVLEPRMLDAFLAYTAQVRLAVLQVQGERRILAPVEDAGASR
jgi:hypothetical protein